ncbi:MAG TPA: IS4 family transposase [Thermomicrobiales bacterium]|nr:IS4 family transposase [Thermomicrobiales bacterium]
MADQPDHDHRPGADRALRTGRRRSAPARLRGPPQPAAPAARPLAGDGREDDLAPFASDVVVLDETTLDQVARTLPTLRGVPPGDDRLLLGKLAGLFDLRRQCRRVLEWVDAVHRNEKVIARDLIAGLPVGSLIITDLGYFGFAWFDDLTDQGHWWLSRLRSRTSMVVLHTCIATDTYRDHLVYLGAHRADRARHAVRLVEVKAGETWHRYLTNQTDPVVCPAADVVALYARRWDIELAIRLVKDHLGVGVLWSAKPVLVQQQVWAVLIIAQILQALRLKIAARAGVEPFDVSMELLVRWAPRLASEGRDIITVFVEEGRRLGFIRPSLSARFQRETLDSLGNPWDEVPSASDACLRVPMIGRTGDEDCHIR